MDDIVYAEPSIEINADRTAIARALMHGAFAQFAANQHEDPFARSEALKRLYCVVAGAAALAAKGTLSRPQINEVLTEDLLTAELRIKLNAVLALAGSVRSEHESFFRSSVEWTTAYYNLKQEAQDVASQRKSEAAVAELRADIRAAEADLAKTLKELRKAERCVETTVAITERLQAMENLQDWEESYEFDLAHLEDLERELKSYSTTESSASELGPLEMELFDRGIFDALTRLEAQVAEAYQALVGFASKHVGVEPQALLDRPSDTPSAAYSELTSTLTRISHTLPNALTTPPVEVEEAVFAATDGILLMLANYLYEGLNEADRRPMLELMLAGLGQYGTNEEISRLLNAWRRRKSGSSLEYHFPEHYQLPAIVRDLAIRASEEAKSKYKSWENPLPSNAAEWLDGAYQP